ncbi:hypothetical protein SISNIDRAFT_486994 [Sistotremastrum niveocremeum HHB9708]|uniref:DUF6532 domain-containing protein n=1 Tax=Sistotremastrum niveocremeum HHB9708 TaxID=1314777 RepID=A0A164T445_9AGAM|nr:hypothetical protein SISNIDRAFT_486994 [Sistotremastrum niveocremeum HHB9708]
MRQVTKTAWRIIRARVVTENAWPEHGKLQAFIQDAWTMANEIHNRNYHLTDNVGCSLGKRQTQVNSETIGKTRLAVVNAYKFDLSPTAKAHEANRVKAELLIPKGRYHALELVNGLTPCKPFQHSIIQEILNAMFYQNRKDEGPAYPDMFEPAPKPLIALILSAVQYSILEFRHGKRDVQDFKADRARPLYEKVLRELTEREETHPEYILGIRETLTRNAHLCLGLDQDDEDLDMENNMSREEFEASLF